MAERKKKEKKKKEINIAKLCKTDLRSPKGRTVYIDALLLLLQK